VDGERKLGLEALPDPASASHEAVDVVGDRSGIGQQGPAGVGQFRPSRAFAAKDGDAQLRLQRRDAVADRRQRAPELLAGAVETAFVDHRKENAKLVDRGLADIHYSDHPNISDDFIAVIRTPASPKFGP